MNKRSCEVRTLGKTDCWPLDSFSDHKQFTYRESTKEIIIIPAGTTQGYLVSNDFGKEELFRFGIPDQINRGAHAWTEEVREELIECCKSKRVVKMDFVKGAQWCSPLHSSKNRKAFVKNVENFLTIKNPGIFRRENKSYLADSLFIGLLSIKSEELTVNMDVFEKKHMMKKVNFGLKLEWLTCTREKSWEKRQGTYF